MLLAVDSGDGELLKSSLAQLQEEFSKEYEGSETQIRIEVTSKGAGTEPGLHPTSLQKVIFFLMNVPDGIEKMSGEISGLVQTSSNLGILKLTPEYLEASVSVRSSLGSAKEALADRICYLTEFLGGEY